MFTLGMNIMKQKTFTKILLATALVMVFAACSSLKPFDAKYVKVEPQPLVVKGGKVPARITLDIPAKWFHKKAEVRVTPVLRYAGGEAQGTTYTFQGEKVRGNGVTIAYKQGGKQTITSEFDYIPAMQQSDLYLTFEARIGKKTVKLPAVKVGEGVIATEQIASHKYATASIAPDMFQRIIKEKHDADIKFLIQQAGLRSGELNKAAIKEWKERVKAADKAANQNVDIEVQAYASPDGGYDLNERLAAQREKNTSSYVKRTLKQNKVDAPVNALYTAQDWEGFKTLVEQSNIQDKDLVLRVLSMYPDPEVREREIKNISSVFRQLADDILPQLRRSRLIANVEIIGKSDEELARMGLRRLTNSMWRNSFTLRPSLTTMRQRRKSIPLLLASTGRLSCIQQPRYTCLPCRRHEGSIRALPQSSYDRRQDRQAQWFDTHEYGSSFGRRRQAI